MAGAPEIQALRQSTLVAASARPFLYWRAAAAAAVLIVIGGMTYLETRPAVRSLQQAANPPRPAAAMDHGEFSTVVGERSTILLKDGSVLTLDTNSAARVAYNSRERGIYLLRGQALFEVAKHKPIPFVVHAGVRRIVATGTAFDVRLDKSGVQVTLVEGHVFVDQVGRSPNEPAARTELQPGERLVAHDDAAVRVSNIDVSHVTDWRSGHLAFSEERLDDAIAEINRYSDTKLILSDPKLATLLVNGVFRTGQPSDFAQALSQIYPVVVRTDDSGDLVVTFKPKM